MKEQKYSFIVVITIFFILLASTFAVNAGIGQTAGELIFGEVPRGGQKTLSFQVINTQPVPMPVAAEIVGNLSTIATVEPRETIIPTGEGVPIYVTVFMPKDAEEGIIYDGSVVVKSDYSSPGTGGIGVSLVVGIRKMASAVAAEEIKPTPPPFPLIIVVALLIVVMLLVVSVGIFKRKR